MTEPDFTLGIEEEYLLVDIDTLKLTAAPDALMEACARDLGDQVSPEFLRCQIEVGTRVCRGIDEARGELRRLRSCVAGHAAEHNLAPIAVSCHPSGDWKDQSHTRRDRYDALRRDMGSVARRMLICGMHVHIGLPTDDLRIDLMPQVSYFLPHLLALSASSPFWQGEDTGLACYRLTVFDNFPRTGLPPVFASWTEYEQARESLIAAGVLDDGTKIWWDLRPSHHFPTLESRICDVSPRIEDALALAAVTQAICRMLWRLRRRNQRWRQYDRWLIDENRWRAQRYGASGSLIDFGKGTLIPMADLVEELVELVAEDARHLRSVEEVGHLKRIAAEGGSADRQRRVHAAAVEAGATADEAIDAVTRHLIDEFGSGL